MTGVIFVAYASEDWRDREDIVAEGSGGEGDVRDSEACSCGEMDLLARCLGAGLSDKIAICSYTGRLLSSDTIQIISNG